MKQTTKTNNTAVSPVIGVILMVAITVILAAVIGTFVLGLGGEVSATPQAGSQPQTFVSEDSGGEEVVSINHISGASIPVEEISIMVTLPSNTVSGQSTVRISEIPSDGASRLSTAQVTYEGNQDIIYGSYPSMHPELENNTVLYSGGTWSPGQKIEFALNSASTRGGDMLTSGDTIEVTVVHEPSDGVIVSHEIIAE